MKHILVVDDDNLNLMMVKYALEPMYKVTTCESAEDALSSLEKFTPDLIIMDIVMNGMSGIDATKIIKKNDSWKNIPVIFLTGDSNPDVEIQCLAIGGDDFIVKPFIPKIVAVRVNRILDLYDLRHNLETELMNKTLLAEKSFDMARKDSLTGLNNRAYSEDKINSYISSGKLGALFMMDLDDFKHINDTYGHLAGDHVLQIFSDSLKDNSSEEDVICRIGGDEFVVYFPNMENDAEVAKKAENILSDIIEKTKLTEFADEVSVSVGIAFADESMDFRSLYRNADKALYYIKNNGKNSYHIYQESKDKRDRKNAVDNFDNVRKMIESRIDNTSGALNVTYGEFQKIYDFVKRYVGRNNKPVQMLLLSIDRNNNADISEEEMDIAMKYLESAVNVSLRASDVGTKVVSHQYMVLLMDAEPESGDIIAERVKNKFNDTNNIDNLDISYSLHTFINE
ncbi:MAG: diguanylate cyclase domain-containing protein [Lachnospira sp.]